MDELFSASDSNSDMGVIMMDGPRAVARSRPIGIHPGITLIDGFVGN